MSAADNAFISGTTLSHFLCAAYACSPGCKYVFDLYGLRQSTREITDRQETAEKNEVVILGALPQDSKDAPAGFLRLGVLTICQAPVHKLSYADTQRLLLSCGHSEGSSPTLFHLTKVKGSDGITRVFYSLYACRSNCCDSLQSVKVNVDNLVDSLESFTKIANVFTRYLSPTPVITDVNTASERKSSESEASTFGDVEVLAREKAALVERIVELTSQLNAKGVHY